MGAPRKEGAQVLGCGSTRRRGDRQWRGGSTTAGNQLLGGQETEAELGAGSTDGIQGKPSPGETVGETTLNLRAGAQGHHDPVLLRGWREQRIGLSDTGGQEHGLGPMGP